MKISTLDEHDCIPLGILPLLKIPNMKSTMYNFCIIFFLFSTSFEDTKNQTWHWIGEQSTEAQIFSRTSNKDHHSTIQDRQEDENLMDGQRIKLHIPQITQDEIGHTLTGFSITEKEFYDHYKKENRGHWLRLRELHQNELINLCEMVHKRESVYQGLAFYQAEPRFQEFRVKLDIMDVEPLVTDLLQCTVEIINIGKRTMFPESDIFYVTEGDLRGSLFRLRKIWSDNHRAKMVNIYGKTDLVY